MNNRPRFELWLTIKPPASYEQVIFRERSQVDLGCLFIPVTIGSTRRVLQVKSSTHSMQSRRTRSRSGRYDGLLFHFILFPFSQRPDRPQDDDCSSWMRFPAIQPLSFGINRYSSSGAVRSSSTIQFVRAKTAKAALAVPKDKVLARPVSGLGI